MALDRPSIEKKDFPIADRGYDPAAVDAHLAALADEVEELKQSSGRPAGSLAAAASEQVRGIVQAAEASASEIRQQAERAAQQIRERASAQAREQTASQARGYLDKVSASTETTIQRLEAMKTELGELLESLRKAAAPGARSGPSVGEDMAPETKAAEKDTSEPVARETPGTQTAATRTTVRETPAAEPTTAAEAQSSKEEEGNGRSEDAESARLIALNMALNDTPRDEVDRYLAQHYRLADRGKLLDEVYESVRG